MAGALVALSVTLKTSPNLYFDQRSCVMAAGIPSCLRTITALTSASGTPDCLFDMRHTRAQAKGIPPVSTGASNTCLWFPLTFPTHPSNESSDAGEKAGGIEASPRGADFPSQERPSMETAPAATVPRNPRRPVL